MGSTNKTAHYELPQFVANDKPSWLGDVNEAMEAIDAGIYGAKSSADGAQQTANNAVAGVASAGTRMDGIQTQLDTVATQANQTATTVAGHTSSIATNSANINTLNSRMGSTDISGIGDGSVTGAIASIAGGGGGGGEITENHVESTISFTNGVDNVTSLSLTPGIYILSVFADCNQATRGIIQFSGSSTFLTACNGTRPTMSTCFKIEETKTVEINLLQSSNAESNRPFRYSYIKIA